MASTLLLDRASWDLVVDAAGNIAVAQEPYALAQDAASAVRLFAGEYYWNTVPGIPYLSQVFRGPIPPLGALKELFISAALTVQGVTAANCFIVSASDRRVSGQIQVTSATTGKVSAANFAVTTPQGAG